MPYPHFGEPPKRLIPTGPSDFDDAAALYRQCRSAGGFVRKLIDCLIAVAAIKAGLPILQCDEDLDVLARHTVVRVVPVA